MRTRIPAFLAALTLMLAVGAAVPSSGATAIPDDPGFGVRVALAAAAARPATTLPRTTLPTYVAADHPACFGVYLFIDDGSGGTVYNDRSFGTVCIVTYPGASVFYLAPGQSVGFWHP